MRKIVPYLFCLLVGLPAIVQSQSLDIALLRKINLERPRQLDRFFLDVTDSGARVSLAVPIILLGAGLITRNPQLSRQSLVVSASILTTILLTRGLKGTIKRPRPYIVYPDLQNLRTEGSYAFPSGHTSNVFATATSISLLYPKWYVITPALLWATSVGYSRLHIGVHYPSDVLFGAVVGAGSAVVFHILQRKIWRR